MIMMTGFILLLVMITMTLKRILCINTLDLFLNPEGYFSYLFNTVLATTSKSKVGKNHRIKVYLKKRNVLEKTE